MLRFCVNAGPAFIISAVGAGMLGSVRMGVVLFAAHILASVLVGIGGRLLEVRQLVRPDLLRDYAVIPFAFDPEDSGVLQAVLALPPKYKDVIYLHYYEDYTAPEIGQILGKNLNTVYTLLNRAKKLLRETLGGEADA